MNLLLGRRPRVRLAGLMLGIAIIGLVLGGVVWFRSVRPEIEARRRVAATSKSRAQYWRRVAGWIDNPCSAGWRTPNRPGAYDELSGGTYFDQRRPYIYTLVLDPCPQGKGNGAEHEFVRRHRDEILALCRARVAYHERMHDRWAWAAWTPWAEPKPAEPLPPIRTVVLDQSY